MYLDIWAVPVTCANNSNVPVVLQDFALQYTDAMFTTLFKDWYKYLEKRLVADFNCASHEDLVAELSRVFFTEPTDEDVVRQLHHGTPAATPPR